MVEQAAAARKQGKAAPFDEQIAQWWAKNDPGSAGGLGWADPAADDSSWKTMNLPAAWEGAGLPGFDGVVWFRRIVELPEAWAGREAVLHLGPIDDIDTTWVNGTKVGETGVWTAPRDYKVPAKVLKAGRNVVAVRVLDTGGGGGIYGQPGQMKLSGSGEEVALAGAWKYKDSVPLGKCGPVPARPDQGNPNVVTVLYNGMIAPILPAAIRGAIWYQGESNAGKPAQYRTLLPTMIRDWRGRFSGGEFPFLIVQLANFMAVQTRPSEGGWAELREAQLWTAQNVPKTGLAVITDIGDAADIHPKNKQDVGKRLALNALAIAHGRKLVCSGPIYREMKARDGKIELRFDHVGGGLVARGDALKGFAIAGEDGAFEWADAVIEGDAVVVSSPKVPRPAAARYGWASNPIGNLFNREGLPASPFRTDAPAR
jgi:sialate O-acetylesterase